MESNTAESTAPFESWVHDERLAEPMLTKPHTVLEKPSHLSPQKKEGALVQCPVLPGFKYAVWMGPPLGPDLRKCHACGRHLSLG